MEWFFAGLPFLQPVGGFPKETRWEYADLCFLSGRKLVVTRLKISMQRTVGASFESLPTIECLPALRAWSRAASAASLLAQYLETLGLLVKVAVPWECVMRTSAASVAQMAL